jgi:hypothetical protein
LDRLPWPAMSRHHQFLKAIRQSSPENLATGAETRAAAPGPRCGTPHLDPELHGLPLGIPAGVLGNGGWEAAPVALSCSQPQLDEEQAPREAGDLTKRKDDNLICREGIE